MAVKLIGWLTAGSGLIYICDKYKGRYSCPCLEYWIPGDGADKASCIMKRDTHKKDDVYEAIESAEYAVGHDSTILSSKYKIDPKQHLNDLKNWMKENNYEDLL